MPATRGMDADQSGHDQDVFYLSVVYHLWVSVCDLLVYGVLVEYQEISSGVWARKGMDGIGWCEL